MFEAQCNLQENNVERGMRHTIQYSQFTYQNRLDYLFVLRQEKICWYVQYTVFKASEETIYTSEKEI